jgi:hypothetical protein
VGSGGCVVILCWGVRISGGDEVKEKVVITLVYILCCVVAFGALNADACAFLNTLEIKYPTVRSTEAEWNESVREGQFVSGFISSLGPIGLVISFLGTYGFMHGFSYEKCQCQVEFAEK